MAWRNIGIQQKGFILLLILSIATFLSTLAGAVEKPAKPVVKGEVRVEGQDVLRLQFHGTHQTFFENPGRSVQVPAGKYHMVRVTLGKTNSPLQFSSYLYQELEVTTNKPAVLTADGPLTNLITVTSQGRTLHLDYNLVDSQKNTYRPDNAANPPTFRVTRNGKTVHTGAFEFG